MAAWQGGPDIAWDVWVTQEQEGSKGERGSTGWPLWAYRCASRTGGSMGRDSRGVAPVGRFGPTDVPAAPEVRWEETLGAKTSSGCAAPVGSKATQPGPPCRGKRNTIRVPGNTKKTGNSGMVLAHRRGYEAKNGYGYKYADLQDIVLH